MSISLYKESDLRRDTKEALELLRYEDALRWKNISDHRHHLKCLVRYRWHRNLLRRNQEVFTTRCDMSSTGTFRNSFLRLFECVFVQKIKEVRNFASSMCSPAFAHRCSFHGEAICLLMIRVVHWIS